MTRNKDLTDSVPKLGPISIVFAALHVLGLLIVLRIVLSLGSEAYIDFTSLFNSTNLLWEGKNPYTIDNVRLTEGYQHPIRFPPLFFVVMIFFTLFSLETSYIIFFIVSEILFLASFYLLIAIHTKGTLWDKLHLNNSAIVLLISFGLPFYYNLLLGQITVIAFFGISIFWYYNCQAQKTRNRTDQILAGLGLSVAIAMKISPGLLILLFLYRKQLWGLISSLGIHFLSILIFIIRFKLHLLTFVLDLITIQNELGGLNLQKMPWRAVHSGNIFIMVLKGINYWTFSIIFLVIALLLTELLKKRNIDAELAFYVLNISMLFIAGIILFHHLLLIYPTFILLLSRDNDLLKKMGILHYKKPNSSKFRIFKQFWSEKPFIILPILIFGGFGLMPLYLLLFTKNPLHLVSTYMSPNLLYTNIIYSSFLFLFYLAVLGLCLNIFKKKPHSKEGEEMQRKKLQF